MRTSWSHAIRLAAAALAGGALSLLTGCPSLFEPVCTSPEPATRVGLKKIAEGFVSPVGLVVPQDGTGRRFVVDQVGQIWILGRDGRRLATPFLDVAERMPEIGIDFGNGLVFDERGLLGLAFHPDFADNGRCYVFYTVPKAEGDPQEFDSRNRISEFRVLRDDANRADTDSERVLLEILKPQFNHNGGQMAFGPDGYLYIGVGDGGAANDEGAGHDGALGNGQARDTLLGKILRIDVDSGDPYGIPPDNPLADDPRARPEIYALGFRNPWRFSFDSQGRLFVADVGQDLFEEVNIVTRGGNYGWRIREGRHCFDPASPTDPPESCARRDREGRPLIDPILEYPHSAERQPFGISVTGGFVYRGRALPCLRGQYIFGDWSTNFLAPDGSLYAATENADGSWSMRELAVTGRPGGRIGSFILSFGQDDQGELYVLTSQNFGPLGRSGAVYQIVPPEE